MMGEQWDAVVFNGYVSQYKFAPIRVEPEERVRVWVLDAGPSENSSFHIVGTIFDTVFKEGTKLLEPDGRRGGAQALDLQPAQGGYVEFTFDEAGLYPIVTHKFANVGKGALGCSGRQVASAARRAGDAGAGPKRLSAPPGQVTAVTCLPGKLDAAELVSPRGAVAQPGGPAERQTWPPSHARPGSSSRR